MGGSGICQKPADQGGADVQVQERAWSSPVYFRVK
jgi:hypothetical protein